MTAEYDGRKSAKILKVPCVLLYDKKKCKTNQDCNDLGCNIYFLFEILRKKGTQSKVEEKLMFKSNNATQ